MFLKTFGKNPYGDELKKIAQSPHYYNSSFQNLTETKMLENQSMTSVLWKFLNKPKSAYPPKPLPTVKTDLKKFQAGTPVIIWFGHSSYLIKINGINILVDPVFSGHASPFSFSVKSFAGTDIYKDDDLPDIDILLITHDHFDHLDYGLIKKIQPKIKFVCTSLGIASHLMYWGIEQEKIVELDWWNDFTFYNEITLTAAPARHFSGRSLVRNKTLWSSFILRTNQYRIFIGGDSGYENHFKSIQEKFTSFDIAILECGQYNEAWHNIHMFPEETAQACLALHAKVLMPVHWGKFSLSIHPWDEPIKRLSAKAKELELTITTPKIGEPVILNNHYPTSTWWNDV